MRVLTVERSVDCLLVDKMNDKPDHAAVTLAARRFAAAAQRAMLSSVDWAGAVRFFRVQHARTDLTDAQRIALKAVERVLFKDRLQPQPEAEPAPEPAPGPIPVYAKSEVGRVHTVVSRIEVRGAGAQVSLVAPVKANVNVVKPQIPSRKDCETIFGERLGIAPKAKLGKLKVPASDIRPSMDLTQSVEREEASQFRMEHDNVDVSVWNKSVTLNQSLAKMGPHRPHKEREPVLQDPPALVFVKPKTEATRTKQRFAQS